VNVSLQLLEGLLLTEEQSFDQLELLNEKKIGGEIVVSLLKFLGSMVLDSVPSRIRALTKSRSKSTAGESKSTQGVA